MKTKHYQNLKDSILGAKIDSRYCKRVSNQFVILSSTPSKLASISMFGSTL